MSRGNPHVRFRVEPELLEAIEAALASRNLLSPAEPWTLSDWVRQACLEKLRHRTRSNRPRKRKGGERAG